MFLMYVPGIIIFLLGSGQFRTRFSMWKQGKVVDAVIVRCEHVVKKDKQDRDVFNYYNTVVEYVNPDTGHSEQHAVKTPSEYAEGQQVRIARDASKTNLTIIDADDNALFHPLAIMIGGALMILLVLFQNQGKEVYSMSMLAALFLGAGICLIYKYITSKKVQLEPVDAEIIDVYKRQISKSTKIIRGDKFTYYPIVKYTIGNKENILRCKVNSSSEKEFKVGNHITLYYNAAKKMVTEQYIKLSVMISGCALSALGVLVAAAVISEVMK